MIIFSCLSPEPQEEWCADLPHIVNLSSLCSIHTFLKFSSLFFWFSLFILITKIFYFFNSQSQYISSRQHCYNSCRARYQRKRWIILKLSLLCLWYLDLWTILPHSHPQYHFYPFRPWLIQLNHSNSHLFHRASFSHPQILGGAQRVSRPRACALCLDPSPSCCRWSWYYVFVSSLLLYLFLHHHPSTPHLSHPWALLQISFLLIPNSCSSSSLISALSDHRPGCSGERSSSFHRAIPIAT